MASVGGLNEVWHIARGWRVEVCLTVHSLRRRSRWLLRCCTRWLLRRPRRRQRLRMWRRLLAPQLLRHPLQPLQQPLPCERAGGLHVPAVWGSGRGEG